MFIMGDVALVDVRGLTGGRAESAWSSPRGVGSGETRPCDSGMAGKLAAVNLYSAATAARLCRQSRRRIIRFCGASSGDVVTSLRFVQLLLLLLLRASQAVNVAAYSDVTVSVLVGTRCIG